MLMRFTVGNYRSFLDPVELDMRVTSLKEHRATHVARIVVGGRTYELLRSAVIYGPNASGKSNFIRAMGLMRHLVLESATKYQADEALPIQPFKLSASTRSSPAMFEVVFLHEDKRYRYGFRADQKRIHEEWLYHARQRETLLYHRTAKGFYLSSRLRGVQSLKKHTRTNALFLSVLAQFNHPLGTELRRWFRNSFHSLYGGTIESYLPYTLNRLDEDPNFQQRVRSLVRLADVGIDDLSVEKIPLQQALSRFPSEVRQALQESLPDTGVMINIRTRRGEVFFDFTEESHGTQKFIALLGPFLDALDHGYVLAVDELEAHLHPFLTRRLIEMFHSPKINPHNAQIIFTTHDLTLLNENLFRRDQVWFMEKDERGATDFYSLADIRERKDVSLLKRYREGRYGAIPRLNALPSFMAQGTNNGS